MKAANASVTIGGETVPLVRLPLSDAQKDSIFRDIDTNKDGTLDMNEFSIYILGKYKITPDHAIEIFKKNDLDSNSTIDKNEFRILLGKIDLVNITVDKETETIILKHVTNISRWATCGCVLCPCTLGLSCCVGTKCAKMEADTMVAFADAAEKDREGKILKALMMEDRTSNNNPLAAKNV